MFASSTCIASLLLGSQAGGFTRGWGPGAAGMSGCGAVVWVDFGEGGNDSVFFEG